MDGDTVRLHTAQDRLAGSAVRAGEDHARIQPGAGPAGGAQRPRARLAAGRLRHRRPAHQSAHLRAGAAGRAHQPVARLYRSGSARRPARRVGPFRPHHRHRHRRSDDGRRAGQGRDGAAQRRARAGSGRPGRHADQDGRPNRRRRHFHHPHSGRGAAGRRGAHHHSGPHRGRHLPDRRRHHRRRCHGDWLRSGAHGGARVQAATGRGGRDTTRPDQCAGAGRQSASARSI